MCKSKAIVTQTRIDASVRPGKCKVYVDSNNPVDKLLDDWYDKNNVRSLTFKSRAWSWLSNQRHKLFSSLIAETLGCQSNDVKFSYKAGCSCGCSPGFNVTLNPTALQYTRSNVWVDIKINEDDLAFDYDWLRQNASVKLKQDKQREVAKANG